MIYPAKKKKKVDYEALNSPFMRIPGMPVWGARALIDSGYFEIFEIQGRSAESLMEDLRKKYPETPNDRLSIFRLAIYYAETENPDSKLLTPQAWM
jgi:hypothetical protein